MEANIMQDRVQIVGQEEVIVLPQIVADHLISELMVDMLL
jgi:hypothetical protein